MSIKKAVRTLQVELPFLLDLKFTTMRALRNWLRVPFERDFSALPALAPPPDALFLDVGANRGQSTDAILMMCPDARIRAFEPNEALFRRLEKQFAGVQGVQLENLGLGDQASDAVLYVPFYKQWMFDGLASFDECAARNWLPSRLYFYNDKHLRIEQYVCRVRPLDDFELAPFFIKIDVQGFEYQVLRGAQRTLAEHRPVLLIETPEQRIIDFLATLGYQLYAYNRGRFERSARGRLNTFFMTAERSAAAGCS